jgi:predicted RNA-binding protein with TRAM domain
MTSDGWWSGTGVDLQDTSIVGSAKVKSSDPTLTIVTRYGIESFWDFGFVQVSTNNGRTWTSLSNAYTTSGHDASARYYIVANLPGLTGDPDYGYSPDWPDWTTMSFDLTAYAGKTVQIRFRYMTDWGTTYEGWWINSATVSGKPLTLSLLPAKASYQVTVVQAIVAFGKTTYVPYDMHLADLTEKGMGIAFAKNPGYVVLVISPTISLGDIDYTFQVTNTPLFKFFSP